MRHPSILPFLPGHAATLVQLVAVTAASAGLWLAVGGDASAQLTNYWPLDETGGETAPNAVVGGTAGTLFEGAGWIDDLERGPVLFLDGVDGFVDTGFLPDFDATTDFTWAFWALSDQPANNNVIVGNRYPDGGWIKLTTNGFEFRDIAPTFNATIDYPDFATGVWVHHAVVKRGPLFTYYRNGSVLGTSWLDDPLYLLFEPPFYFGGDNFDENWGGLLDDVATWTSAVPGSGIVGLASGEFDPSTAPADSSGVVLEPVFTDDFSGDLSAWTATGRGLENNAPAGYDAPSIVGGQLVLGGLTDLQYWYGSSLETTETFDSRLETLVTVDRVSLDGFGTARRSSLWLLGDDGHYLHFSQDDGETGWQFNARDDGGTGTLSPTGSATNILGLDPLDLELGEVEMGLRVVPSLSSGDVAVEMLVDGVVYAVHRFTAFPARFRVVLTGQARAEFDEVTAVFDNVEVLQEVVEDLPPAFTPKQITLDRATEGSAYTASVAGFASDPESQPLTFSKVSGPDWVAVDGAGGVSGTPAGDDIGLARVVVRVEDPAGGSDEANVSIRVIPEVVATVYENDFSSGLDGLTPTNRGLESTAATTYDPPAVVGGELVLGGLAEAQYWYGSSVETTLLDARLETFITVDRVSLDGFGTAWRSSLWVLGDDGHYFHFAHDVGELGWQFNARDDGGAGTLTPTGSGTNLPLLDRIDTDGGLHQMSLEVNPTGTPGELNVFVFVDGEAVAEHRFTAFPDTFRVVLTGQARAEFDEVTAVFDNLVVQQEVVPNNPPAFASSRIGLPGAVDGVAYSTDLSGFASDAEGDTLTFSIVGGSPWLAISPAGELGGTPAGGDVGLGTATVQVEDTAGGTTQAVFSLRVAPSVLPPAAVFGRWPLNEGSGDIVNDAGPNGFDGVITNFEFGGLALTTEAWVTDPERGTVLSFNGDDASGAFVTVGTPPLSGGVPVLGADGSFTWAFFARAAQQPNNDIIIGNRYDDLGADFTPRQWIKFTSAAFEWFWDENAEPIDYLDLGQGVWEHHAVVKQGDAMFYYRDGALLGARLVTGGPDLEMPIFFGGQGVENWRGYLSDIRLFEGALSEAEVAELASGGGGGEVSGFRITAVSRGADGTVTLTWTSEDGATYGVDWSPGLAGGSWLNLVDEIPATGASTTYSIVPGGNPDVGTSEVLYFRVVQQAAAP